jgi:hypothetical protein
MHDATLLLSPSKRWGFFLGGEFIATAATELGAPSFSHLKGSMQVASHSLHQGCDFWNQNDSFLNLNDCASKRPFFNMRSKIAHKFGYLVLICESQSNQRRPCLT